MLHGLKMWHRPGKCYSCEVPEPSLPRSAEAQREERRGGHGVPLEQHAGPARPHGGRGSGRGGVEGSGGAGRGSGGGRVILNSINIVND